MSMSQEEIEALMNGAEDLSSDSPTDEPSLDEIEIDNSVEEAEPDENIDDILAGIDGIIDDGSETSDDSDDDNFDDILAGIDGITDDDASSSEEISKTETVSGAIDESKYPLPVEKEHKVVNQLNEVAEDSEQKASQIFDVLSFVLDENNEIQKFNKELESYLEKEKELLEALSNKFPNIEIFKEQLATSEELQASSEKLNNILDGENNKIFEAMELMQFHDINRQKIERVMAVIRKLTNYLNGIFEDDSGKPEVQIAKHISGDSNETVADDDLDALIAEFGND